MSEQKLREALQKLRSYNVSIAAGQINYRPEDHIAVIDRALSQPTSDGCRYCGKPVSVRALVLKSGEEVHPECHRKAAQPTSDEGTPTETPEDYAKERELADTKKLVHHCWIHSGYRNCGYTQMTSEQKLLFDYIRREQSVSAAPQVKHKVTCKLFPDPYDEREPVGPCTCGAAPQEGKADERIEGRPTAHFEGHEPTGA